MKGIVPRTRNPLLRDQSPFPQRDRYVEPEFSGSTVSFFKVPHCITYLYLKQVGGDVIGLWRKLKHMSVGLLTDFIIESPLVLR